MGLSMLPPCKITGGPEEEGYLSTLPGEVWDIIFAFDFIYFMGR